MEPLLEDPVDIDDFHMKREYDIIETTVLNDKQVIQDNEETETNNISTNQELDTSAPDNLVIKEGTCTEDTVKDNVDRISENKNKSYKCAKCNYTSNSFKIFIEHLSDHGSESKPKELFKCDICHKSFFPLSRFKAHMRTHTGEKPYECDICHKTFTQTSNLKRHMSIHTGERPYECDVCNKTFSRASHHKIHMRIHTGESPYECKICCKAFIHENTHKRHMVKHKRDRKLIELTQKVDSAS